MGSTMTALERLVNAGDPDLFSAFMASISPLDACRISRVSRVWAAAAELNLQAACSHNGWRQPRRARLQALQAGLPWRALFVSKACRACMASAGDFAVRSIDAGAPRLFLCGKCAKSARVVELLQRERATLDVTGLSGKPLYSKRESKFCADVSKLAKETNDAASGVRAEVLRHGSIGRRR